MLVTVEFFLNNEMHEETRKKSSEAALTVRMRISHEKYWDLGLYK